MPNLGIREFYRKHRRRLRWAAVLYLIAAPFLFYWLYITHPHMFGGEVDAACSECSRNSKVETNRMQLSLDELPR